MQEKILYLLPGKGYNIFYLIGMDERKNYRRMRSLRTKAYFRKNRIERFLIILKHFRKSMLYIHKLNRQGDFWNGSCKGGKEYGKGLGGEKMPVG